MKKYGMVCLNYNPHIRGNSYDSEFVDRWEFNPLSYSKVVYEEYGEHKKTRKVVYHCACSMPIYVEYIDEKHVRDIITDKILVKSEEGQTKELSYSSFIEKETIFITEHLKEVKSIDNAVQYYINEMNKVKRLSILKEIPKTQKQKDKEALEKEILIKKNNK